MNFSDKIKFQREQNHLTQKELAELVGVSQRAIAAYESSGTIARISTMRKLAHEPKRKGLALIFYYQLQTLFSYGDYTYNL